MVRIRDYTKAVPDQAGLKIEILSAPLCGGIGSGFADRSIGLDLRRVGRFFYWSVGRLLRRLGRPRFVVAAKSEFFMVQSQGHAVSRVKS